MNHCAFCDRQSTCPLSDTEQWCENWTGGPALIKKEPEMLKTIIAGSRGIDQMRILELAIKQSQFDIIEVVSGNVGGVDSLGEQWAQINQIPTRLMPARWDLYGKSAGPKRNIEMVKYADALIAIWDGKSKGTKHLIEEANRQKLTVFVYLFESKETEMQIGNIQYYAISETESKIVGLCHCPGGITYWIPLTQGFSVGDVVKVTVEKV